MATTDLHSVTSAGAEARSTPSLAGRQCFETQGRPCVLRMEVPIAAGEMVAALYGEHGRLHQRDLQDDEDIWVNVALVLVQDGLPQVERLADGLIEQERAGTLAAPGWLARCRRRVAEVIGEGWASAKHRCPCGYATCDAAAFDAHLDETEGMQPEHFEVLDGWTLEQVLGWQEPRGR